jgi:hypothetical protein
VTRIGHGVPDPVFVDARQHVDETELGDLILGGRGRQRLKPDCHQLAD